MALPFRKTSHSCLDPVLAEVQNMEQTQELKIPEGMPGIQRVIGAWGQVVMRSKDWHGSSVHLSAGMMVWVLYMDEEGKLQRAEGWIPFQLHWELPESCPDGRLRILCIPRYVDARSVSAGKIMVRAGVAALAEAWCKGEKEVSMPEEMPEDVQLLRSAYPVRLPREAGEKSFLLEEELTLPGSAPVPRKLVCWHMDPMVTDRKVLSNKVVFRGNGNLHLLYESEDGQLHGWDFELPFSQFAELEDSFSPDAQVDIRLMPTSVDVETDAEGKFHLKSSLAAQYLVDDQTMVELVEDAYSPLRELNLRQEMLELPALLESRRENLYGEQTLPAQADLVVDARFLPDFPRQRREGDSLSLDMPGLVQLLYYDAGGQLQAASGRWEGTMTVPADPDSRLTAVPLPGGEVQALPGTDSVTVKATAPVQMTCSAAKGMAMVTGLEPGQAHTADPGRPSLVIRRPGGSRLWDLAKGTGTTVDAIRTANGLTGEPAPNQLLLIPIP